MAGNPTRKAAMASALYKNHIIVSAANYSKDTAEWKAWASISWCDTRQRLHTLKLVDERFRTAEEAKKLCHEGRSNLG